MSEELDRLNQLSEFLKRVNTKLRLLSLLEAAKKAYDSCDFESGRNSLNEALNLDSENYVTLRDLGCIELSDGNFEKAIDYYKKAAEYSTHKEIEYTFIGTVYYLQDKLDEAVQYFNLAIDQNDEYTSAYEGRNQAMLENHLKIVDLQEALKKYF